MARKTRYDLGGGVKISSQMHMDLLDHCQKRLQFGSAQRMATVEWMRDIDQRMMGWVNLDDDDKKRARNNEKGNKFKPTDMSLTLAHAQLDELVTYLMSVYSGDGGLYGAVASPENQAIANSFAAKMNLEDKLFGHYEHVCKALSDGLRYNFGGTLCEWDAATSTKYLRTSDRPTAQVDIIEGNRLQALDPYNTIWDTSVKPTEVPSLGEFVAIVEPLTNHRVDLMLDNGEIAASVREVDSIRYSNGGKYYQSPPAMRAAKTSGGSTASVGTNFDEMLTGATTKGDPGVAFELVTLWIWLRPSEFNLSKSNRKEIWRISILNDALIVSASRQDAAHGMLPVTILTPMADVAFNSARTYAELLLPLQQFASYQMNVHQRAQRKALNGLLLYNETIIPGLRQIDADSEVARIPVSLTPGTSLQNQHSYINDAPDTQYTMRDVGHSIDLMQKILPTDIRSQMAGLERATKYEAAAVVQGTNRRGQKLAMLIASQYITPSRKQMASNIRQYQTELEFFDERQGQKVMVSPADLATTEIEFAVSDGLKGIDRLYISESIMELVRLLVQIPRQEREIDLVKVINYMFSLAGDKTDFSQFKVTTLMDQLNPEQKEMAAQMFVQAMQQQAAAEQAAQEGSGTPAAGL